MNARAALGIALLVGAAASAAGPAAAGDPKLLYMLHCQGCHRPDGAATPGAVPALAGWMGRFLKVEGGREYLVRVPGSAQAPISDAELAALLNWMVRRFGPAAVARDFEPFTQAEVAGVRRPPLTDVVGVRRELLARMPAPAQPAGPD